MLGASAWATRTVTIGSTISIVEQGSHFNGRISSSNGACREGRKVKLFEVLPNGANQFLAKARTKNRKGKWSIVVNVNPNIGGMGFFALATERAEGTAGTTYVCSETRSMTVP